MTKIIFLSRHFSYDSKQVIQHNYFLWIYCQVTRWNACGMPHTTMFLWTCYKSYTVSRIISSFQLKFTLLQLRYVGLGSLFNIYIYIYLKFKQIYVHLIFFFMHNLCLLELSQADGPDYDYVAANLRT